MDNCRLIEHAFDYMVPWHRRIALDGLPNAPHTEPMEPPVPTLDELAARVEALEAAQTLHGATVDHVAGALARVEIVVRHHTTRFDGIDARFDGVDARLDRVESRLDAHADLLNELTLGLTAVGEVTATTARTVAEHADTFDMLREWLRRQP